MRIIIESDSVEEVHDMLDRLGGGDLETLEANLDDVCGDVNYHRSQLVDIKKSLEILLNGEVKKKSK